MRYEIGLTILPEALGKRLDALIAKKHPWATRKNELRRTIILDALVEYLDREELPAFVLHPIGTEIPGNLTVTAPLNWSAVEIPKGYKTAEEAVANAE